MSAVRVSFGWPMASRRESVRERERAVGARGRRGEKERGQEVERAEGGEVGQPYAYSQPVSHRKGVKSDYNIKMMIIFLDAIMFHG